MTDRETERILKALANRRRLAIVKLLKRQGEATVGDLAEDINLSFKATSKHLAVLYSADLVEKEQRSLSMFYRLSGQFKSTIKQISNSLE